jgi:hypothetical protein
MTHVKQPDIVERLRAYGGNELLHQEAADEIERLRSDLAEIARLRLATDEGSLRERSDRIWEIANRRALEGK